MMIFDDGLLELKLRQTVVGLENLVTYNDIDKLNKFKDEVNGLPFENNSNIAKAYVEKDRCKDVIIDNTSRGINFNDILNYVDSIIELIGETGNYYDFNQSDDSLLHPFCSELISNSITKYYYMLSNILLLMSKHKDSINVDSRSILNARYVEKDLIINMESYNEEDLINLIKTIPSFIFGKDYDNSLLVPYMYRKSIPIISDFSYKDNIRKMELIDILKTGRMSINKMKENLDKIEVNIRNNGYITEDELSTIFASLSEFGLYYGALIDKDQWNDGSNKENNETHLSTALFKSILSLILIAAKSPKLFKFN